MSDSITDAIGQIVAGPVESKPVESGTAILTGATGGIGRYVALYLADNGYDIIVPCRSLQKGEELRDFLSERCKSNGYSLKVIEADFEDMKSLKLFCDRAIRIADGKIALLINNAGMIAPEYKLTVDGLERSIQVNYVAPRFLTEYMLNFITHKIVNTVSCTIRFSKLDGYASMIERMQIDEILKLKLDRAELDFQKKNFGHLKNYGVSKLLFYLFSKRIESLCRGRLIVEYADPGVVNTGIITMHRWYDPFANFLFRPFIKSPQRGAEAIIRKIVE